MSASAPPAHAAPEPVAQQKIALEAAMLAAPGDTALRARYIAFLAGLATGHTGLIWAHLPELGAPLALRAGTPDIAVLAQVFRDHILAFETRATPRRILVIGAYTGYTAIDLARRYPRASILAAEPLADNFRLLTLNTAAWPQIRAVRAAVWHSPAQLTPRRRFQADWSVQLTDQGMDAELTVACLPVHDLLASVGWRHADMVLCDATGAERAIFADPLQDWMAACDIVLARLYDLPTPGRADAVEYAFPAKTFERRKLGEFDLFTRHIPRTAQPPSLPAEHKLLTSGIARQAFELSHVPPASWGFFVFDGSSCQLHPNAPGGQPSRAVFIVPGTGYQRFFAGIAHAGDPGAQPVRFSVLFVRHDGALAGQGEATLTAQATGRLSLPVPELTGPFRVVLQTAMAPGARHNHMAWARWIDPRLL